MLLVMLAPLASPVRAQLFDVDPDEHVQLFPTASYRGADGAWHVEIHGWIYEPENRDQLVARVLEQLAEDLSPDQRRSAAVRLAPFLADSERGKRVRIRAAGQVLKMPASDAFGHFGQTVKLPADAVAEAREARGGLPVLPLEVVLPEGDDRAFGGYTVLVEPTGLSVISDIDDTIRVSHVDETRKLLHSTFLRPFEPAPGMANVYRRWARSGAQFHYVSSSPWQLAHPLERFFEREDFPPGTMHLKKVRLAAPAAFFDDGEQKRAAIEALLTRFPGRTFVLIGDSAEQDPEIYGDTARAHPQQVALILIRRVGEVSPQRLAAAFEDVPAERWRLFASADELHGLDLPPGAG